MAENIKEFRCPTCGEKLEYDPKTKMNHCSSCDNYYYINTDKPSDSVEITDQAICPNCGGNTIYIPNTESMECESCNSKFQIVNPDEEINLDFVPDYIIPFSVTEDQFKEKFIDILASTDYVPIDVFDKIGFDYVKGYYQPYYKITAMFDANYSASVGYDRKEKYEDYQTVTKNGHTYKEKVIKERTVTDWHPVTGQKSGEISLWASAVRSESENLAYSIESSEENKLDLQAAYDNIIKVGTTTPKKFDNRFLSGFTVTPFRKDIKTAWHDCDDEYKKIIGQQIANCISGDHVKDISWSCKNAVKHVESYYVPVWVVSYLYDNKHYTFIANGGDIDSNFLSKPQDKCSISKAKRYYLPLIIFGFIDAIFILIFLALFFSGNYTSDMKDPFGISFVFLLIITIISWIFGYFKKARYLNKQTEKRIHDKEQIKNNLEIFFGRGPDYYKPENTNDIDSNDSDNLNNKEKSTDKTSIHKININNKKIALIAIPLAVIVLITSILIPVLSKNKSKMDVYNQNLSVEDSSNNAFLNEVTDFKENTNIIDDTDIGSNDVVDSDNATSNNNPPTGDKITANNNTNAVNGSVNNDPCANGHSWTPITKEIPHEETGHYENVKTGENKITIYNCPGCSATFDSYDAYVSHFQKHIDEDPYMKFVMDSYTTSYKYEPIHEKKWIVDSEAYDETVITGYKCSVCGKTK